MLSYKKGTVIEIEEKQEDITFFKISIDGCVSNAINYNKMTGPIKVGDVVVVNTTAVELGLGTGGYHFVIYNYSNEFKELHGEGHIMKLRYTPLQIKCLAVEEQNSPYHEIFNNFVSLDNHNFIVGTLHSMLAPIVSMLKWKNRNIKINYIMTDGGSLPIYFSNTVRTLKNKGLINKTITIGHAFGGDLECVNI